MVKLELENAIQPVIAASAAAKTDKTALIEIKNGKPSLKQKPMSFEKMSDTMQEIVKFREMLEQHLESKLPPLNAITDDFLPLIAKLAQESDKTLNGLSKSMQQELLPARDEDDEDALGKATISLPLQIIEKAIKSIATRTNYGLEASAAGGKVPAAWHIWRWEVKEEFRHWLPRSAKDKAEARAAERRQAKAELKIMFQELTEEERSRIVGSKANGAEAAKGKLPIKREDNFNIMNGSPSQGSTSEQAGDRDSKTPDTTNPEAEKQSDEASTARGRPRKPIDLEKEAKERERTEKKLAKAEKEKKEKEAQEKARSLFANFFGKAKAKAEIAAKTSASNANVPIAGPSRVESEYEKTFKPFVLKKDAELAPINSFRSSRRSKTQTHAQVNGKDVIVIDDDEEQNFSEDVAMEDTNTPDVTAFTASDRLQESVSKLAQIGPAPPRRQLLYGLRSSYPETVRTIIMKLNEAEIAGDDQLVRSLLSLLRSRKDIPAKALIFHEDARPGYFGTWTRPSREVGPRTPFAKDVVAIDYSCDSGEEWEEEEGGEDVVEDGEDEDAGGDAEDASDLEGWLVEDDDVEDPGTPIDEPGASPELFDIPLPTLQPPKRKPGSDEGAKTAKRRKVVVPLVPFTKGPCWENGIGRCEYEPFRSYRVQLFNDAPCPIDPFTFVSAPFEERSSLAVTKSISSGDNSFAVPALPDRVATLQSGATATTSSNATPRRPPPAPKTSFPSEHLPLLVSKITTLETGNITAIVEVVYQELRSHKVKKNAIEAKVREIGEKNKKIWVVKPDFKASWPTAFPACSDSHSVF
ncbi:unnamed protein product [Somion occarium]|uniref:Chromatin assembly factor 1 subunit A dimerization domain-containing protein n=1 Tax=Somion occarium TaxID=3059160 RepID=A0ABP1D8K6_9APHY